MTTPAQLPEMELAHVLFMDIVGYSQLPIEEQVSIINELKQIVSTTLEFRAATERRSLISMHTGDGMALAFFGSPEVPVRCAMEVAMKLKDHARIRLRMGVNSGPVYRIPDIKGEPNVAGGGINFAQRVMNCGDEGHILLSASIADVLRQHGYWAPLIQELGVAEVKHQERVSIFNLYTGTVGNPAIPGKLGGRSAPSAMAAEHPPDSTPELRSVQENLHLAVSARSQPSSRLLLYAGLGVLGLAVLAAVVVNFAMAPSEHKLAPIITTLAQTGPAGKPPAQGTAPVSQTAPPTKSTVLRTAPSPAPATTAAPAVASMAGCWLYNTVLSLQMYPDGRVTGFLDGARWNHEGGDRYTITWPRFVDTVELSPDSKSLTATSNFGFTIPAQRVSGETQGFAGTWQWNNAAAVVVSGEGDVTLGPLHGRWTALGGQTYRIAWTHFPVDQLVLSADGQTLSGQNQFGLKAAGTRISCSN